MITLAWYLLKVIICSGILCGYYFIALRNKAFHRWNRFYLLATIVISLLVPVMKIDFFTNSGDNGTVVTMLQTISYGDEVVVEYSKHNGFQLNSENAAEAGYLLISIIFVFIFLNSLYKIKRLKKKFPETKIGNISFVNTDAKGTPFSFFRSIFWNNAIDLHSTPGQQIFNHEIAHIKEKHSYDKVFMNVILILFWINPFFWLIRKELYMIHEFIADKEALEDSDISAFSAMILQTVYPGQKFSLTNNFFYSPIKRRLLMLTKNKNPKVNYISRLLVLPLAAIVFFAFTLKIKNNTGNLYDGKTITVVIDAGHGGDDNGARSPEGVKEKDITLSIAKKVADLNSNPHIEILLTRNNDYPLSVKDRVEFAKSNNADLFISIHVNTAVNEQLNRFSVLVDKNNSEQNVLLGSALINELKKSYQTEDKVGVRDKGVWVLDHNICPAVLVQCGFLSNSGDLAFITNSADQDKIANNILEAINAYASSVTNLPAENKTIKDSVPSNRDSIPFTIYYKGKKLKYTQFLDKGEKIKATYYDGSQETISKEEARKRGFIPPPPPPPPPAGGNPNSLYIVDGKTSTYEEAKKINQKKIENVNILTGRSATDKYGDKGKKGVLEISTKNESVGTTDSVPDKVFTKIEVEASFPGGQNAWFNYISRALTDSISKFTQADYGTCVVRFIVNTDGKVSDVVATTMKGTELAKVAINAIKNGPRWIPAAQNGRIVASYRLQPVTLAKSPEKTSSDNAAKTTFQNDERKIFIKVEKAASFPGGDPAWLKYISRVIQKNANELVADKNSHGRCDVRFIVSTDGSVSDVKAVTMQGTKLAEVAVNAIKNGPDWIPGVQNGHNVNSFKIQPVTFALNDEPDLINEPQ